MNNELLKIEKQANHIFVPTMSLRRNICKNKRIEQLWICRLTNEQQWRPIPTVYDSTEKY